MVAYYAPEPLSAEAEWVLRSVSAPAVSELVEVELFSAVARKVRTAEISLVDAERVRSLFLTHLAKGYYARLPLETRCFRLARDWLATTTVPLRTLDALHLALTALDERVLATADRRLADAAEALRVPVLRVVEGVSSTVHDVVR